MRVSIWWRSEEDLNKQQDMAIRLANERNEPVECHQVLKLPANSPCICGSGKKFKRCCEWDRETTVTFFPKGWFDRTKSDRMRAIMVAAALAGFTQPLH